MTGRVLRALFVAYLVATAYHVAICVYHEPFAYDAWNIAKDTNAAPITPARFAHYVAFEYTHGNPRIGQPFTYLAYKLVWFAPIVTPIAWLVLTLGITVLGLGRWPSWRAGRGRDLALWAVVVGFAWFALPEIGKVLFCRAYCDNYIYGLLLQIWFLAVLRLRPAGQGSRGACIAYGLFGVAAGLCNEHTGPTLVLFMGAYAWWRGRESLQRPTLAWAGAIGAAIGFCALFFAPGQGERYDGLAEQVSLVGRLIQRGITSNLDIVRDFVIGASPLLALLAVVVAIGAVRDRDPAPEVAAQRRRALVFVGLCAAAGLLTTMTLFVSPKLGSRFFLHPCALLLAAWIFVADGVLRSTRRLLPFVLLAVFASGYAAARTIGLYRRIDVEAAARIRALEASKPGALFTALGYEQIEDSWWFLGDDFRDHKKRELITQYFALGGVILRGFDVTTPLGVSDARLVPRYTLDPPGCLDGLGGIELVGGTFKALDIGSIEDSTHVAVDALRARLPAGARLDRLDVAVQFLGEPPALPRPTLLLARWTQERWEAYVGGIKRSGGSRTRDVVVPKELAGKPYDIYMYQVGGEARRLGTTDGTRLTYVPWKSGAYWELACDRELCFVLAATRQTS